MNELFGGLGGLMKGLSGFMPQDDPDVKLMTAQSELNELLQRETEVYAQIGRQALARDAGRFPEAENKLRLLQENIAQAQKRLICAQAEKSAKDTAQKEQDAARTCLRCGDYNPEGTKFCQECGARLGITPCRQCGAPLSPGIRFCGECGAEQEE